jgi:hypothetical protein
MNVEMIHEIFANVLIFFVKLFMNQNSCSMFGDLCMTLRIDILT